MSGLVTKWKKLGSAPWPADRRQRPNTRARIQPDVLTARIIGIALNFGYWQAWVYLDRRNNMFILRRDRAYSSFPIREIAVVNYHQPLDVWSRLTRGVGWTADHRARLSGGNNRQRRRPQSTFFYLHTSVYFTLKTLSKVLGCLNTQYIGSDSSQRPVNEL